MGITHCGDDEANEALKSEESKYVKPDVFTDDYKELLEKFRQTEKSQIVIMTATTNDQCIDEYVEKTKIVAAEENILCIDQNKVWNEHYDKNKPNFGQGAWLSNFPWDACHPTPKGAGTIAEEMMKYVF